MDGAILKGMDIYVLGIFPARMGERECVWAFMIDSYLPYIGRDVAYLMTHEEGRRRRKGWEEVP